MNGPCPSELGLEEVLARPAQSAAAAHVAGCERCQERLEEMRREGEHFRRFVYPRTLDAVLEGRGRKRSPWRQILLAGAPALAAAAVILVAVRPSRPPAGYVGAKGTVLGLAVFVGGSGSARPVDDGAAVPSSAALRFRVHPSAPCHLWIASLDAGGHVSRIFPPEGDSGAPVSGTAALPGGATLDGWPGPERFFAICTRQPVPFATIENSMRSSAPGGAASVRSVQQLASLPEGSTQASLLIEKTR